MGACRMVLISSLAAVLSAAATAPPALRLGDKVKPVRYGLRLSLDPAKDEFRGTVEIVLNIREATSHFWLNATGLTIDEANLTSLGQVWKGVIESGGPDFVGFSWPSPIAAGSAMLRLAYHGKPNKEARDGLFRVTQEGASYLVTQFETTSARRAFPCFDEPGFKVPWQVTLDVPADQTVLSNAPVISETADGRGGKTVRFAETKPLPSYLVAFAAGPFEVVDVGKFGRKHTPIRIITPRGRTDEAKSAAQVVPELFTRLENYFDISYPYEKLDNIAVPLFGTEAMENAGMIVYGDVVLLTKPNRESTEWREGLASLAAHEMAHQWFGDLVTMAWWNDVWLNEAFATRMSDHILEEWKPEWNWELRSLRATSAAARVDGLASARRITQPAESKSDIANAFDGITYDKGAAVLAMFESSIGEAKFRDGVQRYLRAHAFGNARTEDFLAGLSAASNPAVGPAFRTFLDQPGIPEVSASVRCIAASQPVVELRQKRSQPLGARLEPETWKIPVCMKYGIGSQTTRQCTMLDSGTKEVPLLNARTCPEWLLPNAGAAGYYRVNYPADSLRQLMERGGSQLSIVEQASILADARALVGTGVMPADVALGIVQFGAQKADGEVVQAAMRIAADSDQILPDDLVPNYSRFIEKTFGERARKLGWTSAPDDTRDTKLLRAALLPFVAIKGKDPELGSRARELALKWLSDRNSVEPDMVSPVLNTAAYFGDMRLFSQFRATALASKDPNERQALLGAMGGFANPEIAATALRELERTDFDLTASIEILGSMLGVRETTETVFRFVTSRFDELARPGLTLGPMDFGAILPLVGQPFCSEKDLEREKAFFEPRAGKFNGGPRMLAQTIERIQACIAKKEKQQASMAEFYRKY